MSGLVARLDSLQSLSRVSNPAVRLGARCRRIHQKRLEMKCRVGCFSAAQEKKGETVMGTRELRLNFERSPVAPDRFGLSSGAGIRDRHVLQNAMIRRLIAQRELIRRQRGFVVTLTLEREALAQIIEALLLALGFATAEATPERHPCESTDELSIGLASGHHVATKTNGRSLAGSFAR